VTTSERVITRMQSHIREWEAASDDKALFLSCYMMMSSNMLAAVQQEEFNDPAWVDRLLCRFAEYYFVALEAYERDPASAPAVWQHAHRVTQVQGIPALRKLLLGINAHINYDLVLTLVDLLRPEWRGLSEAQRAARYADHCHVNAVISRTIDAVQDHVIEPAMPPMALVDTLMGRVDEALVAYLIARWRESVWADAAGLLATDTPEAQAQLLRGVEARALRTARYIYRKALAS
jgi:hypothetical protein